MEASKLAALLVSHICHDLSSPASSISMMLEARSDPDMAEQADDIIVKSSAALEHKVTFLRYALGSVGIQEGQADLHEVKRLTTSFLKHHKVETDWKTEGAELSFQQARLLMNMAVIVSSTLTRGGQLLIEANDDGGAATLRITGNGKKIRVNEATLASLQGQEPEGGWNARTIQPYFTRLIAADMGAALSFAPGDESVEMSCRV